MTRKIVSSLLLLGLLGVVKPTQAQLPQIILTDSAKVSLLTCSQGDELYSIFGHSAIRITDLQMGVDWVFNYGTFDFSDPNFYPNFVKGKLNYILSVSTYKTFEHTYIYEGRYIYEQALNLKQNEKQLLLDSLQINFLPENRYYLYDFLFDNCATRIRDIFVEVIPRSVDFKYIGLDEEKSFRQLLMPNVKEKPWAKLGINLLLGVLADKPASPWEYMFLPEHMLTAFEHAALIDGDESTPFAHSPKIILEGRRIKENTFRNAPLFIFILFLLVAVSITYFDVKKGKSSRWFDSFIFSLVGLLGVVIAFQWFGSDHKVMANNYNLLWAHPLHLIVAVVIFGKPFVKVARYYFGANLVLLLFVMLAWFLLPQQLPLPMLPVVGVLALRSAVNFKFFWQ